MKFLARINQVVAVIIKAIKAPRLNHSQKFLDIGNTFKYLPSTKRSQQKDD